MSQPLYSASQLFEYIQSEVKRTFNIELTRRDFIKLVSGGMLGAIATGLRANHSQAQANASGDAALVTRESLPNGIACGDVTQTSIVLWARSSIAGDLRFAVYDESGAVVAESQVTVSDLVIPAKVSIEDLVPATAYMYTVTSATGESLTGRFRTLAETGHAGVRFGVSGDWRGELRPYIGVANVPERNLDFFVALGDTVYADHPSIDFPGRQARSLEDFHVKHNEVYTSRFGLNYWAAIRAVTPIFASIDDHEVTDNFAGGASPASDSRFAGETVDFTNQTAFYQNGLQSFSEYNPLQDTVYSGTGDPRFDGRPKLYRYRQMGDDAAIFILDARSFRDAPVAGVDNFFSGDAIEAWRQSVWQEGRTMLGRTQLDDLKRDILDAHQRGIVWKFVMMPEPVQEMGWLTGEDRWEGYAPERAEFLNFIEEEGITNVVFASADIHFTLVSNLTYQTSYGTDAIKTSTWEISTGSVAYYPPTGQAAIELARNLGALLPFEADRYESGDIFQKDDVLEGVFNRFVIASQGLKPLGLEDSGIPHDLITGSWTIGHSFGWTEFDIATDSQELTVTTYGVPSYSADEMSTNPEFHLNQSPQILGQLRILPVFT